MKLHDILHELTDAVATFTDNHRAEIHAAIAELETLAHEDAPEPVGQAPAETPAAPGSAPVSPAE